MNHYANEEFMWQRLKDMQREAETNRLIARGGVPWLTHVAQRAWLLAGLAMRRAPRRSALRAVDGTSGDVTRVA